MKLVFKIFIVEPLQAYGAPQPIFHLFIFHVPSHALSTSASELRKAVKIGVQCARIYFLSNRFQCNKDPRH